MEREKAKDGCGVFFFQLPRQGYKDEVSCSWRYIVKC